MELKVFPKHGFIPFKLPGSKEVASHRKEETFFLRVFFEYYVLPT